MTKMNKMEKVVLAGVAGLLIWSQVDTFLTSRTYEQEAKDQGKNLYELAQERQRSDIIDILEIEKIVSSPKKAIYIPSGKAIYVLPTYK